MTELNRPLLDGPIAGQHMVSELGGRPWQQAPQYTTVDEAIEYYLDRMSSEEFTEQLVDVLEMDVPVTTLANTIQMAGVMDGKHSIDVGMLVMPLLMEMIMLVGDMAGVKYDSGMENPNKGKTRDTLMKNVRRKLQSQIEKQESFLFDEDEIEEEETLSDIEQEQEMTEEEPKGLMARRV